MSLLKEIKKQPEHIREVFMWLCVVIVFSFVLLAGLRQTEKNLIALVNPEKIGAETPSRLVKKNVKSPLSALGSYFSELRASIADVFNFKFGQSVREIEKDKTKPEIPPALLPLSGSK